MKIVKYGDGATSRPYSHDVILNSATVFQQGLAKLANGGIDGSDAVTDKHYGICEGFVVGDGNVPIENALSSQYDGTFSESGGYYTAASDNQTDKKVKAKVMPVQPNDVIRVEADDTLGTTTGSDTIGYYIDVLTTDERKVDESSASSSVANFLIVGIPDIPGNWLDVKLVEGQIFGQ